MSPDPMPAAPAAPSPESIAMDIDVQTALALARANSRAMKALSHESHRALMTAVVEEIHMQELEDTPISRIVAAVLQGHLAELV